jgi:hypothetical protein
MGVERERLLTVERAQDLEEARAMARWIGRPQFSEVRLAVSSIDEATRQRLARRLLALFNDCGCGWGQVAFLAALPFVLWRLPAERLPPLPMIIVGLVIAATVSIAGKGLGLAWSRWRLRAELRELEILLTR